MCCCSAPAWGDFGAQSQHGVAQVAVLHGPTWGWELCGMGQSPSYLSALRGCVSLGLTHTPGVRVLH